MALADDVFPEEVRALISARTSASWAVHFRRDRQRPAHHSRVNTSHDPPNPKARFSDVYRRHPVIAKASSAKPVSP